MLTAEDVQIYRRLLGLRENETVWPYDASSGIFLRFDLLRSFDRFHWSFFVRDVRRLPLLLLFNFGD